MLFNSIDFAIFLPIVFILYWFVTNRNLKIQNLLLLVASYIFYGWWDWRFLSLIFFSTFLDYVVGLGLLKYQYPFQRKILLWTSILLNLCCLGFFKYYNFFIENFVMAFSFFGSAIKPDSLSIILPVGISFYTFQTLSYTLDVYKRKFEPTKDFIAFCGFVSFFPQLVAGPIERARNLLPQFYTKRTFDYQNAVNGLKQILWGLFKKLVIADSCAGYADMVFANPTDFYGSTLVLGAFFFTFQIYCDFSGYSDIAIGTSRLFGFNLMQNFAFPYFSRDIAEFWRRWHISLTAWFRDYIYLPMGGSKGRGGDAVRNIFIVFIISGFWHGANWTFIVWGALNAILFLPLLLLNKNRNNIDIVAPGKFFPSFKDLLNISITFTLTIFTWIFFRADTLGNAISFISKIFHFTILKPPQLVNEEISVIVLILFFVFIEWMGRTGKYAIETICVNCPVVVRWSFYLSLILGIYFFGKFSAKVEFIYFQF